MGIFPYLGRTIAYNKSYWAAVYQNLRKERRLWGMVVRVLAKMVETVRARGMIYKLVEQSVLIRGSEICVVTG